MEASEAAARENSFVRPSVLLLLVMLRELITATRAKTLVCVSVCVCVRACVCKGMHFGKKRLMGD
jgi:hypothetical protein